MLRNLLLDRFKLVTRREARNMPTYTLVLARNDRQLGPQLRRSTLDCEAQVAASRVPGTTPGTVQQCGGRSSRGLITTFGVPLSSFAKSLSPAAGRFVFDATGLTIDSTSISGGLPIRTAVPPRRRTVSRCSRQSRSSSDCASSHGRRRSMSSSSSRRNSRRRTSDVQAHASVRGRAHAPVRSYRRAKCPCSAVS